MHLYLSSIRSEVVLPVLEYRPEALFIEKPMALSLEEAEQMVAAADDAGTCFVVCHQCRYSQEMSFSVSRGYWRD